MMFDIVDKVVLLTGRRGSGKTTMAVYLYKTYKEYFDEVFLVSYSDFNGEWAKEGIPKENISNKYSEKWMAQLLTKLSNLNKEKTKKSQGFKRILLILDDCCNDVRFHESTSLRQIVGRGRHLGITCILTSQYYKQIPPTARNNSDLIFFMKNNKVSVLMLEEENNNTSLSKQEFISAVERCTENHGAFVINATSKTTSNLDEVYGCFRVPLKSSN